MTTELKPDPSMIGGIAKVPLVRLPDPVALFRTRAERFRFLAGHSANLAPYLQFLAAICDAQARVAQDLGAPSPLDPAWIETARASRMPPIDRARLKHDLGRALDLFLRAAADIDMPAPSRAALEAVAAANASDRDWLMGNVLADQIPDDSVAPHLFVAAAVQVHAALLAATLDPEKLVPIRTGVCPACGGRPVASMVTENIGAEGARYASCACCQSLWNEVRVKCLCCGKNGKISHRSVEAEDAIIKAELCGDCGHWVKLMYQNRNATIEPVADDVASLGLDLKMRETEWTRGGFNPFLMGF